MFRTLKLSCILALLYKPYLDPPLKNRAEEDC